MEASRSRSAAQHRWLGSVPDFRGKREYDICRPLAHNLCSHVYGCETRVSAATGPGEAGGSLGPKERESTKQTGSSKLVTQRENAYFTLPQPLVPTWAAHGYGTERAHARKRTRGNPDRQKHNVAAWCSFRAAAR